MTSSQTLDQAKAWLRAQLDVGARCPCCTQFAKVYRRRINSTQARALAIIYRERGRNWAHLPSLRMKLAPHHSNEEPKLRYWGLLEEEALVRPDGGRAGWWRVTDLGEQWVQGLVAIPKYVCIFDSRPLRLEGEPVHIQDALGARFSLAELMAPSN